MKDNKEKGDGSFSNGNKVKRSRDGQRGAGQGLEKALTCVTPRNQFHTRSINVTYCKRAPTLSKKEKASIGGRTEKK